MENCMKILEMAELPFCKVHHIGVIVKDLEQAIQYYEGLGMGPFAFLQHSIIDRKLYGNPAPDVKCRHSMGRMGSTMIELVQPVSGESLQNEWLSNKGEGINHIAFSVNDLDQEVANVCSKGFHVVSSGKFREGGGFAYFDINRIGGVFFELFQEPPKVIPTA
jgi:methylmalonyl-CoA/ethylmalonyl-CoA epimerase